MRTLREEPLDFTEYDSFDDARARLQHWLQLCYNTGRIHSALDDRTPAEFEQAWQPVSHAQLG